MSETFIVRDIGGFVIDSYCEYGKEVNLSRHVPRMEDGLKPVYKRLILASLNQPDKKVKTSKLLGDTMSLYHPHSTDGCIGSVSELVHAGVFEGKGSFGYKSLQKGKDQPEAAPRYTEVKLSSKLRPILSKLLPYVPTSLNELDNWEPDYIPTPYPLSLQMGSFGIGIGLTVNIPAFQEDSIVKAGYEALRKKPEPWKLLQPLKGLSLSDEDKRLFWMSSRGTLKYKFTVTPATEMGMKGWYITGDPSYIKPNLKTLYDMQKDGGKVVIQDFSTGNDKKIFIARSKRIKTVTDSEVELAVEKASEVKKSFNLCVVFKGQTRPITGGDWIQKCLLNFNELVKKYRDDSINKLNFEIEVYNHFKEVSDRILNTKQSYETIRKSLKLSEGIVSRIAGMKISTLRDLDPAKKIEKLKADREVFVSMKTTDLISEFLK
jgi:hypothetical protein